MLLTNFTEPAKSPHSKVFEISSSFRSQPASLPSRASISDASKSATAGLCLHDAAVAATRSRPKSRALPGSTKPTLWHIPVSHYNEKVRWALAWKGVEHRRRAPVPGTHMPIALWLTRGGQYTFPVLTMDGRHIGDSTEIIAVLEERFPEPALYPADADERRRALELEDFFDEELGPPIRQLVWHELAKDGESFALRRRANEPAPACPLQRRLGGLRKGLHRPSLSCSQRERG